MRWRIACVHTVLFFQQRNSVNRWINITNFWANKRWFFFSRFIGECFQFNKLSREYILIHPIRPKKIIWAWASMCALHQHLYTRSSNNSSEQQQKYQKHPKYANKIIYLAANKYTYNKNAREEERGRGGVRRAVGGERWRFKKMTGNVNGMGQSGNRFNRVHSRRAHSAHVVRQFKQQTEKRIFIWLLYMLVAFFHEICSQRKQHKLTTHCQPLQMSVYFR